MISFHKGKGGTAGTVPPYFLGNFPVFNAILLEVTLQQALQCLAVSGLVAGHLMDGVVDGIQTVLLGADGQVGLALGGTELAVNAPCQIVLGGGLHAWYCPCRTNTTPGGRNSAHSAQAILAPNRCHTVALLEALLW